MFDVQNGPNHLQISTHNLCNIGHIISPLFLNGLQIRGVNFYKMIHDQ